jgi:hypothetical protein
MPPQKRSKKNTPTETDQEENHNVEGNGISLTPEPSNITDQERRAKLEALQRARAEKTTHIQEQPTEQQTHENDEDDAAAAADDDDADDDDDDDDEDDEDDDDDDDDDEAIDKELERVQQKIQQLQKEKEKFANQLQAKRKASEKLEKLNQAKEQIETIQREIKEMQEQENSSLSQDSRHQDYGPYRGTPKENIFTGNGISQFVDPKSPVSIGLQTVPWPSKFKPVSLPKYNGFGNSRQFLMRY